jgi:membrane-associated phospholipid phosphatase
MSRLYLGEHWIMDILGGYLFAIAWSSTAIFLFMYIKNCMLKESK